jgi:hypothetical protein
MEDNMNIINEQFQTANTGWPDSLGVNYPSQQKEACYKMLKRALDFDEFFGMTKT